MGPRPVHEDRRWPPADPSRHPPEVRAEIERLLRRGIGQKRIKRKLHDHGVTTRDVRDISMQIGTHSTNNEVPPLRVVKSDPHDKTRQRVEARDGMTCRYCGRTVYRDVLPTSPDRLTIDHIVPKALGGRGNQANLVVACYECNHRKGNDPIGIATHGSGRLMRVRPLS